MPNFQSLHNPKNSALRLFRPPPLPVASEPEFKKSKAWLNQSNAPLFIEVGCGVGLHPIQWSKQNPNTRLLAFERTSEKYEKAWRRLVNNNAPSNVHITHADAAVMLPYLLKSGVRGFYFLYPNPYPKESQKNLRLAHAPFLHFVREALVTGGQLTLATNSVLYASEAKALIPQQGFMLKSAEQLPTDFAPRTHFEKKYLARREPCFNLVFLKTSPSSGAG